MVNIEKNKDPMSVDILRDCINLQLRKSADYQNPMSSVKQADYYPNGIVTLYDIMHAKMLRIKSLYEASLHDKNHKPNHESISDSLMDLINYASFAAAYINHGIDGQSHHRDMFNRFIEAEDRN